VGVWAVKFYYPGLLLYQLKYSLFHFMVLEWKCLVTNLLCPYCIFFVTRVQPDLSKGKKKKKKTKKFLCPLLVVRRRDGLSKYAMASNSK
jgi:hypothetical protein